MLQTNLVPSLDPNPLPAPYWLLKALLIATFTFHIVAMNLMLGGGVVALLTRWRAKDREVSKRMFHDIAKKIPILLPATISLGIAPLLFVQVLYGQFFYTSSILMAWPWFLVLVLLTVAYYGFYYVSYESGQDTRRAGAVMYLSVLLVFLIGFLFTNNITLSQTPARWGAKYFASAGGWHLNLSEPTLIPRYLHFFVAAVAVGGLLLVFMAWANWKRDRVYAGQLLSFGGKTFLYATMTQFVVGIVFLFTLPLDKRMLFMGSDPVATGLFLVGVVGGLASIFLMSHAVQQENIRLAGIGVPAITACVIVAMSIMRDILRDAYLKPYYDPSKIPVQTQTSVLALFLGLFVCGVVVWVVMLWRYGMFDGKAAAAPKSPAGGAQPE